MQISIVIPTRNEAKYIADTIGQYLPFLEKLNLEIVISDAWSTDGTVEKVLELARIHPEHIRLVQAEGQQNIAIGRNYGARHACGELLFITDADVRIPYPDHFFSEIRKAFADAALVAATAPLRIYPDEEKWNDRVYHFLMNGIIRLSFTSGLYLAKGECQMVRKSAFEAINGYDETLVAGEDCNLFFRIQQQGRLVFLQHLSLWHSPRRFRAYGYAKVSLQYLMEGVSRLFMRRSFAQEWKVVR